MITTRQVDGIRAYFVAVTATGKIAPGIAPGDITVTVVAPDLTTGTTAIAAETTAKPGLYTALVPSAFLITNGVGDYALTLEIDSTNPRVAGVTVHGVLVTRKDIDDVFRVSQAILGNVL